MPQARGHFMIFQKNRNTLNITLRIIKSTYQYTYNSYLVEKILRNQY